MLRFYFLRMDIRLAEVGVLGAHRTLSPVARVIPLNGIEKRRPIPKKSRKTLRDIRIALIPDFFYHDFIYFRSV